MRTDLAIGQEVYMRTRSYIDHEEDDFCGGLCRVTSIKEGIIGGLPALFFTVEECPGCEFNWEFAAKEQDILRKEFGSRRGFLWRTLEWETFEDDETHDD